MRSRLSRVPRPRVPTRDRPMIASAPHHGIAVGKRASAGDAEATGCVKPAQRLDDAAPDLRDRRRPAPSSSSGIAGGARRASASSASAPRRRGSRRVSTSARTARFAVRRPHGSQSPRARRWPRRRRRHRRPRSPSRPGPQPRRRTHGRSTPRPPSAGVASRPPAAHPAGVPTTRAEANASERAQGREAAIVLLPAIAASAATAPVATDGGNRVDGGDGTRGRPRRSRARSMSAPSARRIAVPAEAHRRRSSAPSYPASSSACARRRERCACRRPRRAHAPRPPAPAACRARAPPPAVERTVVVEVRQMLERGGTNRFVGVVATLEHLVDARRVAEVAGDTHRRLAR